MDRYTHIASYVYGSLWAILPDKLSVILSLVDFRVSGGKLTDEEIAERIGAVSRPSPRSGGSVAVIPIYGVIAHHAGMMEESSGGISSERITQAFRSAMADNSVGAVILELDSPGGTVAGTPEIASEIFHARGQKPIVAVANTLAASAAYWIASAADELVVSPSGQVGSVGVIAAHQDVSEAMAKEGVKTTLITAGQYKAEGNPYMPLDEEAHSEIQRRVDEYYGMFTRDLAKNRGVPIETVREDFGGGRVFGGPEAVRRGMADSVGTLEETIARLMQAQRRQTVTARAERVRSLLTS